MTSRQKESKLHNSWSLDIRGSKFPGSSHNLYFNETVTVSPGNNMSLWWGWGN